MSEELKVLGLEDLIPKEKEECRKEFLSQKNFYKSLISGIILCLGLLGGSLVWAINDASCTANQSALISEHDKKICKIENKIEKQHIDEMNLLKEIKEKVNDKR